MSRAATVPVMAMPDPALLGLSVSLILVGLVAISSASIEYAEINYNSTGFHTLRHLIYMADTAGILGGDWLGLVVRCAGAADPGAYSRDRTGGQWQSALVAIGTFHAATLGIRQAGDDRLPRRLHGTQGTRGA